MKINVFKRPAGKKSEVSKLRREGHIPAVLYHRGKESETVAIQSNQFQSHLRQVEPGRLSTKIFTLVDEQGKEKRAILKEIQYDVISYNVIHLDFEELVENTPVRLKVPIECVGGAECPGVKLGGVVRQVIRQFHVSCLPKDIPEVLYLDIKSLGQAESRRLSDSKLPETIRPLANLNEVAVVIVKR